MRGINEPEVNTKNKKKRFISSCCHLKLFWIHIELAQSCHTAAQLEQRLYTLQDLHMREANLLDKLELGMFAQRWNGFSDPEHGTDDIMAGVSQLPEFPQRVQGRVYVSLIACLQHGLHLNGVRRINHFEDIVARDEAETGKSGLQVVDGLTHITLGTKDQRRETVVAVLDLFGLDDL